MTRTNSLVALVLSLAVNLGVNAELIKYSDQHITIEVGKSLIQITKTLYDKENKETGELMVKRLALCVGGAACADPGQGCYVFRIGGGEVQEASGVRRKEFQVFYVCANDVPDQLKQECKSDDPKVDFAILDQQQEKLNNEKLDKEQKKNKTWNKLTSVASSFVVSLLEENKISETPLCGFDDSVVLHKLRPNYYIKDFKADMKYPMMYAQNSGPFASCAVDSNSFRGPRGVCKAYGSAQPMRCVYARLSDIALNYFPICVPDNVKSPDEFAELSLQFVDEVDVNHSYLQHPKHQRDWLVENEQRQQQEKLNSQKDVGGLSPKLELLIRV